MAETIGLTLAEISRLIRRRFDARAREIGVTRAQWHTLMIVARHEGLNQGGIAELMEIEPITACRMIDRLEDAGLVERRRDPNDRRAWRIFLKEEARPLLEQLRAIGERLSQETLTGLSPEQLDALVEGLTIIRANLTNNDDNEAANG